jgi:hypothetical protein
MSLGEAKLKNRAVRIFLSYADADRTYARHLQELISPFANFRIFTTDALSAGENWTPKLREEIARSDVFVVLLSPASVRSAWVLQELGAAWGLDKPIVPVLTQPEVTGKLSMALQDRRTIDYRSLDDPGAVTQFLDRLTAAADEETSPNTAPEYSPDLVPPWIGSLLPDTTSPEVSGECPDRPDGSQYRR